MGPLIVWCRHEESNHGPTDYKSVALPTELRRRCWMGLVLLIAERIIGFYGTPGKGFCHDFGALVGPGAGSLVAQHDLFLAIFLNHGAGTLSRWQADIDEEYCLVTHSRSNVRVQVQ